MILITLDTHLIHSISEREDFSFLFFELSLYADKMLDKATVGACYEPGRIS